MLYKEEEKVYSYGLKLLNYLVIQKGTKSRLRKTRKHISNSTHTSISWQ